MAPFVYPKGEAVFDVPGLCRLADPDSLSLSPGAEIAFSFSPYLCDFVAQPPADSFITADGEVITADGEGITWS